MVPGLTNLVRWQSHWHVVRQGWTFFQNDFAGRIAARVMQTGPALRESVTAVDHAASGTSWSMAPPRSGCWRRRTGGCRCRSLFWFVVYIGVLVTFLPRMRERSRRMSEMRSVLTGKVVDSYTNILTVKLFARARDEDAFMREAVDEHTEAYRAQQRMTTMWSIALSTMNAFLHGRHRNAGDPAVAFRLYRDRHGCDSDPDGVADQQHVGLAGAADRQRSSTISGRCRTACARSRCRGRCPIFRARWSCRGRPARSALRRSAFDYGRTARQRRRAARARSRCRAGRARRAGRPLRRRQIDAGATCCSVSTGRKAAAS